MQKRSIASLVFLAMVTLVAGCGPSKAKYTSPSFDPQRIDRIVVLPFIDNRDKPNPKHDFREICGSAEAAIFGSLNNLQYRAVSSGDIGSVTSYAVSNLPSPDSQSTDRDSVDPASVDGAWVKNLGPDTDQWILVPVLDSLSRYNLLIKRGAKAKISLYLFDKERKEIAWKGVGYGEFSAGVLMAPLVSSLFEAAAVEMACMKSIEGLAKKTEATVLPE